MPRAKQFHRCMSGDKNSIQALDIQTFFAQECHTFGHQFPSNVDRGQILFIPIGSAEKERRLLFLLI